MLSYLSGLSAAALLLFLSYKTSQEEETEPEDHQTNQAVPECLNFKVDQGAINRLRDPSIRPSGKLFTDQEERANWLRRVISDLSREHRLYRSPSWDDAPGPDGLIHEYSRLALDDEQRLREFASLGYEIQALGSVNLPRFHGLQSDPSRRRIERLWSAPPECELVVMKMSVGREQLERFVSTLAQLQRLGLRVETLPVWALLQQEDGELFIPHLPQSKEQPFPTNLQIRLTSLDDDFPGHFFTSPDGAHLGGHRAFQFQLASLVWRLLAGGWPYDREPILGLRGEQPCRVAHDFGPHLTPVLLSMTSLKPQERYDELGSALQKLAAALVP